MVLLNGKQILLKVAWFSNHLLNFLQKFLTLRNLSKLTQFFWKIFHNLNILVSLLGKPHLTAFHIMKIYLFCTLHNLHLKLYWLLLKILNILINFLDENLEVILLIFLIRYGFLTFFDNLLILSLVLLLFWRWWVRLILLCSCSLLSLFWWSFLLYLLQFLLLF